jgi:uncharacterized membrane-anchored protein YhcB (DUF1043 family)
MESKINLKMQIVLLIIGLVIGLIAGYFIFSTITFSSESNLNELNILNKEINHCIDKLNQCEFELENCLDINLD